MYCQSLRVFLTAAVVAGVMAGTGADSSRAQGTKGGADGESSYPFSWSSATTYSLDVSSFGSFGSPVVVEASGPGTGTLDYVSGMIEKGYFSKLGVEALILTVNLEVIAPIGDSTDAGLSATPSENCAVFGRDIPSDIGNFELFSSLVAVAHSNEIRIALSIDAASWCGDPDAAALARWAVDYRLDGVRFKSADRLSVADAARLRDAVSRATASEEPVFEGSVSPRSEAAKVRFWIAGIIPDMAAADGITESGLLDAATISDWQLSLSPGDSLAALYRRAVAFSVEHPTTSILSQASSEERGVYDRTRLIDAATRLLLQPGAVDIMAGDEGSEPAVLDHWQKLGTFRDRHPAIGGGAHEDLDEAPYMFYRGLRMGSEVDEVLIVLGATGKVRLKVSLVFRDDTVLRDAYTGRVALVSYGQIRLTAHENGVMLLEEVR